MSRISQSRRTFDADHFLDYFRIYCMIHLRKSALRAWIGSVAMSIILASTIADILYSGAVAGTISAAVVIGYRLALLDSKSEITATIAETAPDAVAHLDNKFSGDYTNYQSSIDEMRSQGAQ